MFLNLQPQCLGMGSVSLDECIRLAKTYGFGGIDVPMDGIRTDRDADLAGEKIAMAGLKCGLFWMPCDPSSADDASFEAGLKRLREMAPLLHRVGLRRTYCHIWPSSTRSYSDNMAWHVGRIRKVAEILWPHGIRFGIEFLGPMHLRTAQPNPFIHTLDGALEMIGQIGEGAGLVLDTFHWYCSGGTLETLPEKLKGVPIVNVHCNDGMPGRAVEQQLDYERALPMEHGVVNAGAVLKVLKQVGYDGPVIVEPFTPWTERFGKMPKDEVAAKVAGIMKPLMEA